MLCDPTFPVVALRSSGQRKPHQQKIIQRQPLATLSKDTSLPIPKSAHKACAMAPLTQTTFDDYTLASVWPRPVFLLAAGLVSLLLFILRKRLTSKRYLRYVNDAAYKVDDETPLSAFPPPLRSVYHHQQGPEANKSSKALATEAATRQLAMPPTTESQKHELSKRHSCPNAAALLDGQRTVQEPPQYSQLIHDSVEYFPTLDDEGKESTDGYWRRRTLIYA